VAPEDPGVVGDRGCRYRRCHCLRCRRCRSHRSRCRRCRCRCRS